MLNKITSMHDGLMNNAVDDMVNGHWFRGAAKASMVGTAEGIIGSVLGLGLIAVIGFAADKITTK